MTNIITRVPGSGEHHGAGAFDGRGLGAVSACDGAGGPARSHRGDAHLRHGANARAICQAHRYEIRFASLGEDIGKNIMWNDSTC